MSHKFIFCSMVQEATSPEIIKKIDAKLEILQKHLEEEKF